MREDIDTTENFEVDPAISHVFRNFVFINEFSRNVSEIDADIFGSFQWSLEVKAADFKGELFGALT